MSPFFSTCLFRLYLEVDRLESRLKSAFGGKGRSFSGTETDPGNAARSLREATIDFHFNCYRRQQGAVTKNNPLWADPSTQQKEIICPGYVLPHLSLRQLWVPGLDRFEDGFVLDRG